MADFDAYVMIDWSGGDRRRAGRPDCIWIAHGAASDRAPATQSPGSRRGALDVLRGLLQPAVPGAAHAGVRRRTLVCADFAFGYPAGFAALLPGVSPHPGTAPWRAVWSYLQEHIRDDLGTPPGALPSNRSNRFDVAAAVNAAASVGEEFGPFWCHFEAGRLRHLPQRRPAAQARYRTAAGDRRPIRPLRCTDRLAASDTPFRLFGTGSVGSQALTGIPRLAALRFDRLLAPHSAVWPFETGWSDAAAAWPPRGVRIVYAEIYPSLLEPRRDRIKDRGQVRALWHWARELDAAGALAAQFARPVGVRRGSALERTICREEGWILGCPPPPATATGGRRPLAPRRRAQ